MHPRRFKNANTRKLKAMLAELNQAKGLNGVRYVLRKYFSKRVRHFLVDNSPEFFLMYYLGFRVPAHQQKWISFWWTVMYLLEMAPRDHGKSWIFSYGRPLCEIYTSYIRSGLRSVDFRFLQISKTDTQADKYATQARETIEKNGYLREDFGDIRDLKEWSKGSFRCVREVIDSIEKDYTYEKTGVLGSITGGHFHVVNCDDILDDENTKTVDRLAAIENWFFGTIWNLKEAATRIVVVGTRKNRRDLYNTLMALPVWKKNVERAIIMYPMIPDPEKPGGMKQGWVYITDSDRKIWHPNELRVDEICVDVELLTDEYKVLWPSIPAVDNDGKLITEILLDKQGQPVTNKKTGQPVKKPKMFGWGIKELLLDRAAQGSQYFDREKQNDITSEEGVIFNPAWYVYFDSANLIYNSTDGYHYLEAELAHV